MELVSSPQEELQAESSVGSKFLFGHIRFGKFRVMSNDIATLNGPAVRPGHDPLNCSDLKLLRQYEIPKLELLSFLYIDDSRQISVADARIKCGWVRSIL